MKQYYQLYEKQWDGCLWPCIDSKPIPEKDSKGLELLRHFVKTENEIISKQEKYFIVRITK